jgi:adenylate cyclase
MWQQLRRQLWEWRGVWTVAPSVATVVIALRVCGLLQHWEWGALDQYIRWRPLEPQDERIVIVGINEVDLKKARQWPISDAMLAQLLVKVKNQNPRVIGLDLYRDLPVEPGHSALANIFQTTPNLIGIEKLNENDKTDAVAPPPELAQKGQVAINNIVVDPDGKLRRGLLSDKGEQSVPSLSFVLAGMYLQAQNILPQPSETNPKVFQWGKSVFQPFTANEGGYVDADDGGYQILLNYRGPAKSFRTVSLTDVLEDRIPANLMRDRIVLIGSTATSLNDLFYTPYSGETITTPERTPGVEIQANLISHIISAALEGRPGIKTWSEALEWLWILLWSGVGATLTWKWRYTGKMRSALPWASRSLSWQKGVSSFLAAGTLWGTTYLVLLRGWWIPVVPPFLGLIGSAIVITAYLAHSAGRVRQTFGRYLSDSVVATLLESPGGLKIGGESRKITILTSDLRGFTAISERLQPQEVVKILNLYLEKMAEVITQYEGTIEEFIGDGILVLFGAPTLREDDSIRAVACAVAMQLAMSSVNKKMELLGFPNLEMGIGINTGEVVVGNIGSEKRTKYTVIGSHVNLTYRIESYTVGGQILISESTLQEVKSLVRIDSHKEVKPKGVKQPITIYEIGGMAGEYNLFLPKEEEVFFPLPEEIRLQFHYTLLDGKHIGDSLFKGSLVKLSPKGAEVRANHTDKYAVPEPLSNIKLNLSPFNNSTQSSEDVYAKVLEKPADNGSFYIHFTAKPPDVDVMLKALYERARTLQAAKTE